MLVANMVSRPLAARIRRALLVVPAHLGTVGHINIPAGFGRWTGGHVLLERLKASAAAQSAPGR